MREYRSIRKIENPPKYLLKNNVFNKLYPNFSILEYISFLLFIFCYYLYYLSLEKCLDGFDICGKKKKWILIKLCEAFTSYFILAALLQGIILKIISRYHLLHLALIYIYFYFYSHGLDFDDHGYFNFLGTITIVPLSLFAFIPFNILIILLKKKINNILLFISYSF